MTEPLTIADLLKRIEALEQEVAALKARQMESHYHYHYAQPTTPYIPYQPHYVVWDTYATD